MITEAHAYIAGWKAYKSGLGDDYIDQVGARLRFPITAQIRSAWRHGWLDANDAEEGERPDPDVAGYGTAWLDALITPNRG